MPKLFLKNRYTKTDWGTKRRVMTSFKIDEISGVDNPAQAGALVVMCKRAEPEATGAQEFCKIAFREALDNRLVEQKFNTAFYESFDGMWSINDALRDALQDRYQDGEEAVREYIEEITGLAMRALAAAKDIAKAENKVGAFAKAVLDAVNKETETMTKKELKALIAEFEKNGGTDADISAIKKAAKENGATNLLPKEGALSVSNAEKRADTAEAELAKRDAVDALDVDMRKHYDGLDADAQAAFLAKSAADQASEIEGANADDPVVYTTKSGIAVRKSEGATVAALAKQADADRTEIAELKAEKAAGAFAKRAETEFPNLPTASTAATLKAADGLTEEEQADVVKGLTLANKAAAGAFENAGSAGATRKSGATGAQEELDTLTKAYAKENNVSESVALGKVLDTEEGARLYTEADAAE